MNALDNVRIDQVDDSYVASKPSVGAVSGLSESDLVAFHLFCENKNDKTPLERFYQSIGVAEKQSQMMATEFCERMEKDGWMRNEYPDAHLKPLSAAYLTVTRECNLACPYCYQGLSGRRKKEMPLQRVRQAIELIADVNPDCEIILTGGEPLLHSNISDILDYIDELNLPLSVLTNGVKITAELAARFKVMKKLRYVQVSLDGISEKVFAQSRGRGVLKEVIAGIDELIHAQVPFMLAPTLHKDNLHEIHDIAEYAVANGGYIKPNNLRHLPNDNNKTGKSKPQLVLTEKELMLAASNLGTFLRDRFGKDTIDALSTRYLGHGQCSVETPNAKSVCGFGYSLLDIDWNGDVYPCHLAKAPELMLGNFFEDAFVDIIAHAESKGMRKRSHDIPSCSKCTYVSRCAGGCRMGAYYSHGSFEREDDLCGFNYRVAQFKLLSELNAVHKADK